MAAVKYRKYKNGIYGYRYRNHYISYDNNSGTFDVYDESLNIIRSAIPDRLEAQEVVLLTESDKYPKINIEKLTSLSLHELDAISLSLANKEDETELSPEEVYMHAFVFNLAEIKVKRIKEKNVAG